MILAPRRIVGFAALPFTSTTLMGIHHASVVPCHFTTSGVDSAYTGGDLLVRTARGIICQAAASFAGPTISRTLSAVFSKTAFSISTNRRGLTGVHTKVSIVINIWTEGKAKDQFGNHIDVDYVYRPIAVSICKVDICMNTAWKFSLSGELP